MLPPVGFYSVALEERTSSEECELGHLAYEHWDGEAPSGGLAFEELAFARWRVTALVLMLRGAVALADGVHARKHAPHVYGLECAAERSSCTIVLSRSMLRVN